MKKYLAIGILALPAACFTLAPTTANAFPIGIVDYHDPTKAYFGGGNPDGEWTSAYVGDLGVGARFKNRNNGSIPNGGDGFYDFGLGETVNVEMFFNSGALPLNTYSWIITIDLDPTSAVNNNPFTYSAALYGDNSYVNSLLALNGSGVEGSFSLLGGSNSIMQLSQPLPSFTINSFVPGQYTVSATGYLAGGTEPLVRTEATVTFGGRQAVSVPEGGPTAGYLCLALLGLGLLKKTAVLG